MKAMPKNALEQTAGSHSLAARPLTAGRSMHGETR